jgi:hypothetical protein
MTIGRDRQAPILKAETALSQPRRPRLMLTISHPVEILLWPADAFKAANVLSGGGGQQHKAVFLFSFETDLAGG